MRLVIAACALAATAACGGSSVRDPGKGEGQRNAAAPASPSPAPSYTTISYSIEGPGIGGKWRVDSDGTGSFDELGGDAQGRYRHLTATIHAGPAGFAEIERLVSELPAGEPHCDDYRESLVAMGRMIVTRERPGHRVETRFDLNCSYRGPGAVAHDNVVAAGDRMRQWASQAPGHKDVVERQ